MASVKRKRESSPSPSSSSTRQPKYDVFLSFRGEDTRTNFTDHLYVALQRKGIITFRDEEELKKGERISELFKAIEESQFAIIILSRNYASSTWCLDELAKIIKCQDEKGLKVLPVFYDVSPSVVRKQTESFEQAFIDHQKRFEDDIEKVETWRGNLKKVADIKGWDLHLQNRHESEIIQHIVKEIMEKLSPKCSSNNKNLIGIESMVAELIPSYLDFGNNIYMMGICGMGGLGKTTLARAIYDKYSNYFECSSFIADVREISKKGKLYKLQQQLLDEILGGSNKKIHNVQEGDNKIKKSGLRHKKVLLVLDDVDHKDQLEKLAGEHDWFGLGSWIIITTRDEHVLINHGVLKIYKPNGLDYFKASKLFCLKAFKNEQPKVGYKQLSSKVVKYASGLPLALVSLGSFLEGRTVEQWQSALDSFKDIKINIYDILKKSYDGLEEIWKEIFLDIACFFRGSGKDEVIEILKNCGFDAEIGISVLVEKSLLTIDDNKCLRMHDLQVEMGQKIIRFESGGNLGKQSRLWLVEDLLRVLENDMATEAIQAIVVRYGDEENTCNFEEVPEVLSSKMSNLRLMIIENIWTGYDPEDLAVPNDQRQLFVPNQLRHLSWNCCPLKCLSSSSQPQELVRLNLYETRMEYLWEGVMRLVNLKFIDLGGIFGSYLIKTPDFSGVPMLEELNLMGSTELVEIHPSIGQLSRLRYLDLEYCTNLTDLPCMSAVMQSLTVLILSCCFKIRSFPKFTGIMKSLSKLDLSYTAIEKVETSSIKFLTALTTLSLRGCKYLECLTMSAEMQSLRFLNLSGCHKISSFPKFTGIMKSLSSLYLRDTSIKKVETSSIEFLTALTCLDLSECKDLECLPSGARYIKLSYELSAARVKLSIWSQPLSQWCLNNNCQLKFRILFHYLLEEGLHCRKTVYVISSEGKEDGFTTETLQNSVSIKLPSNWYDSKWRGFALWASVSLSDRELEDDIRARVIALGDMPQNHCASELFTTLIECEHYCRFGQQFCLLYLSRDDWFAKVGNGECNQIKFIFEKQVGCSYDTKFVGTCGASLAYVQDVDEFNQTNAQCLIESFGEKAYIFKLTVDDDDEDMLSKKN